MCFQAPVNTTYTQKREMPSNAYLNTAEWREKTLSQVVQQICTVAADIMT